MQQPVRPDLADYVLHGDKDAEYVQFVCGTKPFDGYPTKEEYEARFARVAPMDGADKDRYYDHLPIWTGGNIYFNGAQPCDKEQDFYVDTGHKVSLELAGDGTLTTNLFDFLPERPNRTITTQFLGMAFEPEQFFENPDGSPIVFDTDYFGNHREVAPLSGPFAVGGDTYTLL